MRSKTLFLILTPLAAAAAALAYILYPATSAKPRVPKAALVSMIEAKRLDLPRELNAQGHLVALNQVEVRPQVTATIRAIHFKEGDDVQPGQLLFTLDDADARALLQRTEAQAAQIRAQLADARRDHGRATALEKSNFIASSAVDTAASKVDALTAQLQAAQAEVAGARATLAHTRIVSPIAARSGAVAVHPGSLAQTGATAPLVTLVQFSPIGVEFNLPEQDLPAVLNTRRSGPVTVSITGPDGATVDGKLTFIDNIVHTASGTISLKAEVPNPGMALWPGAFAKVTVQAGVEKNAVVLPPQAVLEGPRGRFVYVVGADGKAAQKPVTLLRLQDEQAVLAGLESGTSVVLEGGAHLRPGGSVRIAPPGPHASAGGAASDRGTP